MPSKKLFLGVELSSSRKVNFLVLVSIIGLLGLIIVAPYLYDKKNAIYAPMYIDSSKEHGVLFNITIHCVSPMQTVRSLTADATKI